MNTGSMPMDHLSLDVGIWDMMSTLYSWNEWGAQIVRTDLHQPEC